MSMAIGAVGARLATAADAPAGGEYKVTATWAVGGAGGSDYITADSDAHRLYIPRTNHVQVVDSTTGKLIGDVPGINGGHGVALVPDKHLGFATSGRANAVVVFDTNTFKVVGVRKVAGGPDAIIYDPGSGMVLSMGHASGNVSFIDPAKAVDNADGFDADKIPEASGDTPSVEIGGALESAAADGEGHAYVNVEDKNEVVELDTKAQKVLAHWTLGDAEGPTGLALDPKNHRLYVGCSNHAPILDSQTGKVLDTVTIGGRVDAAGFDPGTGEGFISCGDGNLAVIRTGADGKFTATLIPTKAGAGTMAVDTSTHTIYLPVRGGGGGGRGRRGNAAGGGPATRAATSAPANAFTVLVVSK
jgi:hypothetical protein